MPVPNHRPHRESRRAALHLDQDYDGSRSRHRGRGVHDNTQRAMVGIRAQGVKMGYLDNHQERQQNQAHRCYPPETKWFKAAADAAMSAESGQTSKPFLIKDTQV